MIRRGDIHWVDLGAPAGPGPAKRRPVLIISNDSYNDSAIATVVAAELTSQLHRAAVVGNIFLPANLTGLPKDSVVNVTGIVTIAKDALTEQAGHVPDYLMDDISQSLRRVLDL